MRILSDLTVQSGTSLVNPLLSIHSKFVHVFFFFLAQMAYGSVGVFMASLA